MLNTTPKKLFWSSRSILLQLVLKLRLFCIICFVAKETVFHDIWLDRKFVLSSDLQLPSLKLTTLWFFLPSASPLHRKPKLLKIGVKTCLNFAIFSYAEVHYSVSSYWRSFFNWELCTKSKKVHVLNFSQWGESVLSQVGYLLGKFKTNGTNRELICHSLLAIVLKKHMVFT